MRIILQINALCDKISCAYLRNSSSLALICWEKPWKSFDGQAETMMLQLTGSGYFTVKTASG